MIANLSDHNALPTQATDPGCEPVSGFPYETGLFHRCWWQSLASRFDIPVKVGDLLICRKKLLKGVIQLREARIAGWNNAWNQDLTAERVDALEELAHTSGWDYFRMTWSESRQSLQAIDALAERGFLWLEKPAPSQYWIDLSQGFDAYLSSLSANGRKSLKKKARLSLPFNPRLEPCQTDEEIEAFFEEFFPHHWAYWDEKSDGSYFHAPEECQFIIQWAKALNQEGQLILDRLIMSDKTVNMSMAIRAGNAVYWLLTLNTGELQEATPGMVGLHMRLEQFANDGVTSFHMGAGDYFYKVQCANRQEACHEVIVCNPRSIKGQLYYQWAKRQQKPVSAATSTE